MRLSAKRALDDLLVVEEPCLGAAFCTYAFDPRFFEEQMLRALLRLRSDPDEQAGMYHEEARRALQEAPVAVLLDASVRQPGRRLPYDQLIVRSRIFHPKLVLALYESHARILIGSANLTRGGYDENVELVFARSLAYAEPSDALMLREIDRFLGRCAELASARGTQLALVRETLARRLGPSADASSPRAHAIVHSFDRPILDQLIEQVPEDAFVTRIGVLAPFFERDDAQAVKKDGLDTFLGELTRRRRTRELVVDLATGWDDAPVAPPAGEILALEHGLERVWAWRRKEGSGEEARERVEYVVPWKVAGMVLAYRDAAGNNRRANREEMEVEVEERRLWAAPRPRLHLPHMIVESLRRAHDARLWMHPTAQLDERGRVQRRPLHAKLLLVTAQRRGKERTWIMVGSSNASRGAMLRAVEQGGNVELAVMACVEGEETLRTMLPSLVHLEPDGAELIEREMAEGEPDLGAWIADAVHSPAAHDLRIEWATEASAPLGSWMLRYDGRELARGSGVPGQPTWITEFELLPTTAELELVTGGREHSVPIRVSDLAELPTSSALARLDLRELLALLGRRVGAERLATLARERGRSGVEALLESILGSAFGPVDVFKAWWGVAHDLEQPSSVPAFRHRLRGPLGLTAVWGRLREEAGKSIGADEAWIYGCELEKTLRAVTPPPGPDHEVKVELLAELLAELGPSIRELRPSDDERAWLGAVARFYQEETPSA